MGHLVRSTIINAPLERVWQFITRTSRLTEWAADEIRDASADEMVVGTTWTERLQIAGAPLETTWRIHAVRPPHELEFAGVSTGGGKAHGHHTLSLHSDGTLMTTEVEYSLPGALLGRMVDKLLMERKTESDIEGMLARAKTQLERTDTKH